jgi:hypothetical protein
VDQRDRRSSGPPRARRLYNPADITRHRRGGPRGGRCRRTDRRGPARSAGSPRTRACLGEDPYAAAADSWAAGQPISLTEDDDESAARRLYDLALEFQERSQRSEARLLDEFEGASAGLVAVIGDLIIVDDDDERLSLTTAGFRAEVIPEDAEDEWRTLTEPTSWSSSTTRRMFMHLADALAEVLFVAPSPGGIGRRHGGGRD